MEKYTALPAARGLPVSTPGYHHIQYRGTLQGEQMSLSFTGQSAPSWDSPWPQCLSPWELHGHHRGRTQPTSFLHMGILPPKDTLYPSSAARYESKARIQSRCCFFAVCHLPSLSLRFKISKMGIFLAPQDIVRSLRGKMPGNGTEQASVSSYTT